MESLVRDRWSDESLSADGMYSARIGRPGWIQMAWTQRNSSIRAGERELPPLMTSMATLVSVRSRTMVPGSRTKSIKESRPCRT